MAEWRSIRVLVFTAAAALLTVPGCSDDAPTSPAKPDIGFMVITREDYARDGGMAVYVYTEDLLPAVPEVTVNGRAQDSCSDFPAPVSWTFSGFHALDTVVYRIAYGGDVVTGTVVIPGPIDSVFCNGAYLPDTGSLPLIWVLAIDTATFCRFSWKAAVPAASYRVSCSGDGLTQELSSTVQDTAVTLQRDTALDYHVVTVGFTFDVLAREGNAFTAGSLPDNGSGRLFVYHDLCGPQYEVDYRFGD